MSDAIEDKMKFLVLGCGSIGKRHIRNLKNINAGEIIAYDVKLERCHDVEEHYGIRTSRDLEQSLAQRPDVALICNPTSLHISSALIAAHNGCHLFIEKPLSHSLDGIDELIEIVDQKELVTLVACNMRFHPGISKMKELLDKESIGKIICARAQAGHYLPSWHPWEDYRYGYSGNKSLGGGVILDGIHEIDYITWLLGEVMQVFCFSGKLSSLEIDTEDTAEILLKFKSGAMTEVHLDYVQRSYARSCLIIGEEGTILWDFNERQVRFYSAKSEKWQIFHEKSGYDINEMYIEEMKHFLQCVVGKTKPLQDINRAKRVLQIALAAKESSLNGEVVAL